MSDLDRQATRVSAGIRRTLDRLGSLILAVACVAFIVGFATFATGWWVFDGSRAAWTVIGGAICAIPVAAALTGWVFVRIAAVTSSGLIDNAHTLLGDSGNASSVLIDYDSGQALAVSSRSFSGLQAQLKARRRELPALYAGVRAISRVPGLAAIAVLGIVMVGGLGTILLIGGVID